MRIKPVDRLLRMCREPAAAVFGPSKLGERELRQERSARPDGVVGSCCSITFKIRKAFDLTRFSAELILEISKL